MSKYNIFHTERNRTAGLRFGHPGMNDTRREGGIDGFETRSEAEAAMREMQDEARRNGRPEYAEALHVESFDYA